MPNDKLDNQNNSETFCYQCGKKVIKICNNKFICLKYLNFLASLTKP